MHEDAAAKVMASAKKAGKGQKALVEAMEQAETAHEQRTGLVTMSLPAVSKCTQRPCLMSQGLSQSASIQPVRPAPRLHASLQKLLKPTQVWLTLKAGHYFVITNLLCWGVP